MVQQLIHSAANGRPFVLQTTFPPRELKDDETIEGAKLANSVVVQRLT
jgi:UBX domain-containing protein 1